MGWEIFTRQVVRTGEPRVTLMATGRIGLNKIAGRRLEEKAIENVLLLWDKESRQVGIKPISKKDSRSYKLSYASKGNAAGFSAVTFFRHISYSWDETRTYPVEWNDEENMYVFTIPPEHLAGSERTLRNPAAHAKKSKHQALKAAKQKESSQHMTQ